MDHLTFVRLAKDAPPFSKEGFQDPSPFEGSAHIEFSFHMIGDLGKSSADTHSALQVDVVNLHPISRECLYRSSDIRDDPGGSVTIHNSNPFHYPFIDIGLLAENIDVSILREGVRSVRRLLGGSAFEGSVFGSVIPPAHVTSDGDLEDLLRNTGTTFSHAVGSASMSPKDAEWGVVDPDFRVKGASGLRVVDASVIVSCLRMPCRLGLNDVFGSPSSRVRIHKYQCTGLQSGLASSLLEIIHKMYCCKFNTIVWLYDDITQSILLLMATSCT